MIITILLPITLVQYFGELGCPSKVFRNDQIDLEGIRRQQPAAIVISPGPCTPKEAGISIAAVEAFSSQLPILGVCLGHQSICHAFGGEVGRAEKVMHGKVSKIFHKAEGLFDAVENPFTATRYHSLIAKKHSLPDCLEVTAWTDGGTIMAVKHEQLAVYGVQFHPESFLTPVGHKLLQNFLSAEKIAYN